MWRYREAIPIKENAHIVSFDEGFTPLIEVTISGKVILIKQEQMFPTGSFKDRGASVLISQVRALGIEKVVEDSSGNAGAAIAAYCANAGTACEIFCPRQRLQRGNLAQIALYGAKLNKIPGTREDTAAAVFKKQRKPITMPAIPGTLSFFTAPKHLPLKCVNNWGGTRLTLLFYR